MEWPHWQSRSLPISCSMQTFELLYIFRRPILSIREALPLMSMDSFKHQVLRKLSSKLISKSGARARIIDMLLARHFDEVLEAIWHNRLHDMISHVNTLS